MTNEKAKEIIREALLYKARRNGRGMSDLDSALMFAVCALEKRIPKKGKDICDMPYDAAIGICPICENGVNAQMNFCDKCGQRLDWSEEDE